MKQLPNKQKKTLWGRVERKSAFIILVFFWFGGCSIWNGYLDPDNKTTRADRLCHPYGECSQGNWVTVDGSTQGTAVAKMQCNEIADHRYENGWWGDSVSRGLEIARCMEKKGFRLQQ